MLSSKQTQLCFTTVLILCAGRAAAQPAYGVAATGSTMAFLADIPNDYHTFRQTLVALPSYSNSVHAELYDTYPQYCPSAALFGDHSASCNAVANVSIGSFSGTANAAVARSPVSWDCDNQTIVNTAAAATQCYGTMEFDDTVTLTSTTLPSGTLVPFRMTVVAEGSLTQGLSEEYTSPDYAPYVTFTVSTNYFDPAAISLSADKNTGFFSGAYTTQSQWPVGSPFGLQAVVDYGMRTFSLESGFGSAQTDERIDRIAVYLDALTPGAGFAAASGHDYSSPPATCNADFNGDGDVGTDADIEAFFACLAGDCCPSCGSADFNGDGDTGTDADIEAFFRVLAGGAC